MPVAYPLINGVRYDFSSIEVSGAGGKRLIGVKSVNYNHSLEPGEVRGTTAQAIGRTRGQYKAEASLEVFREDWDDFLNALVGLPNAVSSPQPAPVPGYMEVSFGINVAYSEQGIGAGGVQLDQLIGCRIKKDDNSNSQGTDALTVKVDLHVMLLIKNGKSPLSITLR